MFVVFHLTTIRQRVVPLNTLLFFSALVNELSLSPFNQCFVSWNYDDRNVSLNSQGNCQIRFTSQLDILRFFKHIISFTAGSPFLETASKRISMVASLVKSIHKIDGCLLFRFF